MRTALILSFGVLMAPTLVQAAAFCVAGPGLPPQCLYDDIVTCQRASDPPNSACIVNPQTVLSYVGGSNTCLVSPSRIAQCIYTDRDQCNGEAYRSGGVCISRTDMADNNADPYRFDPRIQGQGGQSADIGLEDPAEDQVRALPRTRP